MSKDEIAGEPRDGTIGHAQDLADLADGAYEGHDAVPPGWRAADPSELGLSKSLFDDSAGSGFSAKLYVDADGNYVVSYRGSDQGVLVGGKDAATNRADAFSTSDQQTQAINLATQVQKAVERKHPGAKLEFTGHSLGGGLASLAAIATGLVAITFNAAGVTNAAIRLAEYARNNKQDSFADFLAIGHDILNGVGVGKLIGDGHNSSYENLVTAYCTFNDPLTTGQELSSAAGAVGKRVILTSDSVVPLAGHGMESIKAGLARLAPAKSHPIKTSSDGALTTFASLTRVPGSPARGFVGADAEALERLAADFERAAAELNNASQTVTRGVESSFWLGPVAVRFEAQWKEQHVLRLAAAREALHTQRKALLAEARQQRQTSAK